MSIIKKTKLGFIFGAISVIMILLNIPGWAFPGGYVMHYLGLSSNAASFFLGVIVINFCFFFVMGYLIQRVLPTKKGTGGAT